MATRHLHGEKRLNQGKIPVFLLTGFLGAGKTTFLKRVFNQSGPNFKGIGSHPAVFVNDFASLSIDSHLYKLDRALEDTSIFSFENGCICCSLSSDFKANLQKCLADNTVTSILVELSGTSVPSNLIEALRSDFEISERIDFIKVIGLFDCLNFSLNYPQDALWLTQLQVSDAVVLTKHEQVLDLTSIQNFLQHYLASPPMYLSDRLNSEMQNEIFSKPKQIKQIQKTPHVNNTLCFSKSWVGAHSPKSLQHFFQTLVQLQPIRFKGIFCVDTNGKPEKWVVHGIRSLFEVSEKIYSAASFQNIIQIFPDQSKADFDYLAWIDTLVANASRLDPKNSPRYM